MTTELIWKAVYNDGTELLQESGIKYSDINREKLQQFELYKDNKLFLVINLDENKRLIFRKRVAMKVMSGDTENVYLVGWQEKVNGSNIQNILFIFEDGHIEVVDRFYENHRWFYPIKFIEEEKI